MGRKPDLNYFIPPEVACYGNYFARKWQNSATNAATYWSWWQLFYTAAVTSFEWEGLPDGVDARFLEQVLFFNGTAAVTQRTDTPNAIMPHIVAGYAAQGKLDCYNNPNKIVMTTANGQTFTRHASTWIKRHGNRYGSTRKIMPQNAVVGWDSITRRPLFNIIDLACRRLAEFDITIDQHVRAERAPFIFAVPEEGKANAEALYNRIDSGQPAIYVTPLMQSVVQGTVLQTGIDYVGDKLLNDELKIVSQTYTALGIDNNASAEKKERVQTAETLANNEQFLIQRESRLRARQDMADAMNRVFGSECSVRWSIPHVGEGTDIQAGMGELSGGMEW